MSVLEKILEEIEEKFKTADVEKCDCEELCDVEDWYDSGYIDGQLSAHEKCMDIIRSHMDEAKDINVPSNDELIGRKALKEKIENLRMIITGMRNGKTMTAKALEEYKKSILRIIDEQQTENNDNWIPVEERLPKETEKEYYPVMYVTTSYGVVAWGFYRVKDEQWYLYNDIMEEFESVENNKIVAWQPFPKPYRPKEQNNGK